MRNTLLLSLALLTAVAVVPQPGVAQTPDLGACSDVQDNVDRQDWRETLYVIDFCKRAVTALFFGGILDAVSVEIAGARPGEGDIEGAMGITVVNFEHAAPGGTVESTFTAGSGGAEDPISALSSLTGGLASAFGASNSRTTSVRLPGRNTGQLEEQSDGSFKMTVGMEDGLLVQEHPDADYLERFAGETVRIIMSYFGG